MLREIPRSFANPPGYRRRVTVSWPTFRAFSVARPNFSITIARRAKIPPVTLRNEMKARRENSAYYYPRKAVHYMYNFN